MARGDQGAWTWFRHLEACLEQAASRGFVDGRSREEGLRCSTIPPFGLFPHFALGGCGIQGKGLESEYLGSNPVSSFPASGFGPGT